MNCVEKIYDLDIVRSISIRQSWFGKIFRYGTVNVEISASGGYTDQTTLSGVSDPQQSKKCSEGTFRNVSDVSSPLHLTFCMLTP